MGRLAHLLAYASFLSILIPSASAMAQAHPVAQSIASLNHELATIVSRSDERVVLATSNMKHGVELMVGQRAVDHLQAIKAQHPDRFEGMGKYLSDRGYVPTQSVMVARLARFFPVTGQSDESGSSLRPVYQGSTSEGELVIQSWDDGDDSTWEGTVYVERYSDGSWSSSEGQIDIATSDYDVVWADAIGGGGPGGDPLPVSLDRGMSALQQLSFATATPSTSLHNDYRPCFYGMAMHPYWQDWADCFVAGAAGCAAACALSSVGWPECTGACAIGVQVT